MKDNNLITNTDIVPVFTIEERKRQIPSLASRIVLGAKVVYPWRGRKDIVVIEDVYGATTLSSQDYVIANKVAERITKELSLERVVSSYQILKIRDRASDIIEAMIDARADRKGIVMLKDRGGCGYWRMVLPAQYMDKKGIYIDITSGGVAFDRLLEYHTVFVQRLHDWDSFYILKRLKEVGKRVVYDIDDDLFSIPEDNPASKAIGKGEQMAALECMSMVDLIVVTTKELKKRLEMMGVGTKIEIVRNALDPDDKWIPTSMIGSPDGWKRIFWQGSNTHDSDWECCVSAVNSVLQRRTDVKVVLLGHIPAPITRVYGLKQWKDRVEFSATTDPEAYFRTIKHIRADVSLAPLSDNKFNRSKSEIKWIESSLIGIPVVASNICPYNTVINNGKNGFLCSSVDEWTHAIDELLDDRSMGRRFVDNSRAVIRQDFNVSNTANLLKTLLLG